MDNNEYKIEMDLALVGDRREIFYLLDYFVAADDVEEKDEELMKPRTCK